MLNFNQLRVFYHAARNLSYTAAANALFITQPAVTAQMKAFEEFCNLKLFKKRRRKIFLTDEGKALFSYAEKIFKYEKEIENVIDEMRELKRGILVLGTTKAYARYFMPLMITTFHENYPEIKIQLNEGSSLDMIYSLLDFKIEVAVIAKAEDNPELPSVVGIYPQGASPSGVMDLCGNVWEWCLNAYANQGDHIIGDSGTARVIRGGSFYTSWDGINIKERKKVSPIERDDHCIGFRLVKNNNITIAK